jgi:prepilin-type N-terminal cleavage/methylation domain-containing protein
MGARRRAGFTLIELLVVVAVTALLISILLPSFGRAREDARRTVCVANLKHIGVGLFTYAGTNNDRGPQVMAPISKRAPRTLLSIPGSMVNLGLTLQTEVHDPAIFKCPSQKQWNYNTNTDLFTTDLVAGSYAYAVNLPASQSPHIARLRHLAMVSDDFVAKYGSEGIGKMSHRNVYNVLYTDGSAARYANPSESIWKSHVYWDDETDEYTYASIYTRNMSHEYEGKDDPYMSIFKVWHAFCYSGPDPFAAH